MWEIWREDWEVCRGYNYILLQIYFLEAGNILLTGVEKSGEEA